MVVEWGTEWTVQRVRVTGTNGGNGLNAAGEYNTAAITTPVARANTWVWGTGHADGNGIGNPAEGVAITLGNGVAQNATESQVAVGTEIGGTAVDFEVWTLTHPLLAVDYRFKADGDAGNLTVDVPVDAAGADRMALVYNGQDGNSDDYPRPIFSARYLNDITVRLERRRSGSAFPAWVQGIDFSAVAAVHDLRRRRSRPIWWCRPTASPSLRRGHDRDLPGAGRSEPRSRRSPRSSTPRPSTPTGGAVQRVGGR